MDLTQYLISKNKFFDLNKNLKNKNSILIKSNKFSHCIQLDTLKNSSYAALNKAKDLTIGVADSPFGQVLLASYGNDLCEMSYCDAEGERVIFDRLKKNGLNQK